VVRIIVVSEGWEANDAKPGLWQWYDVANTRQHANPTPNVGHWLVSDAELINTNELMHSYRYN